MRHLFRLLLLVVVVLLIPAAAHAASEPADVIERLHQKLIETMKAADQLGIDGRYHALEPILIKSFDFERMVAAAAGSYWTAADEAQRQRLLAAFTRMSVMTYASRFVGFSGEKFELTGTRQGPRDTVLVDTRLVRTSEPAVPITYVMAEKDGEWRIVDVLLDRSISELAVRRSEYNQVLRDGGPDKLTEVLNQKTAQLSAG